MRQELVREVGAYQRRADLLTSYLITGAQAGPTQAMPPLRSLPHAQPSVSPPPSTIKHSFPTTMPTPATRPTRQPPAHLDIPPHVRKLFEPTAQPPRRVLLQDRYFADGEEDKELLARIMQLRVGSNPPSVISPQSLQQTTSTTKPSDTEVDREYRERINKLAGREIIPDPASRSLEDGSELTEEDEIATIMKEVHDEIRMDLLGAGTDNKGSSEPRPTKERKGRETRHRKRRPKKQTSSEEDTAEDTESDSEEADGQDLVSDGSSDEGSDGEVAKRRARMERERHLTFGERWELRKKERQQRKTGRPTNTPTDPLQEREKAFMARKEQEERAMKMKYHQECMRNYGKFL